jgi:predicted DNA-binding WGR domain protein
MESTEELWITFQANPHMSQRVVESGNYSYLVDLVKMTQTNVSHPARKVRNIRRDYNGVVTQGTATPASSVSVTLNPPATSMFAAPTPAPVAVAPPVPIPVPPPPPKAPRKAAAAPPSGPPVARPVDSHCPLARIASVQVVDDYDIMLNQADIKANKNKFYRLQLLYDTARSSYHFWTRWGRVGEGGQNNLDTCGNDKDRGIAAFKKKFKDKTGENWESGPNFTPRSGKYEVIEMKTAATAAVVRSLPLSSRCLTLSISLLSHL